MFMIPVVRFQLAFLLSTDLEKIFTAHEPSYEGVNCDGAGALDFAVDAIKALKSDVLAELNEFHPLPGSFSFAQVSKSEFGIC